LELEKSLFEVINMDKLENFPRKESSRILCIVSFEHSESLKMLIASGNFTSAIGLLRLQYEAFTRAIWLFYTASDLAVSKLMSELTAESARKTQKLPMLSKMLETLEGKAPQVVLDQLLEFREYSWKPLSSYIHGGIHAIQRHSKGYPLPLLKQTIKASNGVSLMAAMFLIIIANDISKKGVLPKIQKEFKDCLPELKKTQ
jgi:uncharacterized protein DUF6988